MRRLFPAPLFLLAVFFATAIGCGDSPSEPQSSGWDLSRVFTEDEAVVSRNAPDTNLRMVGLEFESGTATLTAESLAILDKFALVFQNLPGASYLVEGHTDERGAQAYNLAISKQRANAVRDYLVDELGGEAFTITAVGYGETKPLDPGHNEAAWAMNRRIEIVVHDPPDGEL